MNIFEKILTRPEFDEEPPVLVDVGSSGSLHPTWKKIRKYSICVAFDADSRETGYIKSETKCFRKLYIFPQIVTVSDESLSDFYLTKSPYCSSLLKPLHGKIRNWSFAPLFQIEKKISLKAITLKKALEEVKLDRVDWFKTDSQGTDLRLFLSLGDSIIDRVLVAEFEPGIIDAYEDEDKLWQLMSYMDTKQFWMSDLLVRGAKRIETDIFETLNKIQRKFLIISPGWAETTYFRLLSNDSSKRDLLLAWLFSAIKKQHGYALEIALRGQQLYDDEVFLELRKRSLLRMTGSCYKLPGVIFRKLCNIMGIEIP